MRFLLGYDVGSSSIKVSLLEAATGKTVASATSPASEMAMLAPKSGWAEQSPELWWQEAVHATAKLKKAFPFDKTEVGAIGIAYQMHGLVLVDKDLQPLRPSIIWCDSRAVEIGERAFTDLGELNCLKDYLNSPANFTASKLRWVIENEPEIWKKTYKILLPGDFIALRMTGEARTTISGLSEGIFWDFETRSLAQKLLEYYDIPESVIPKPVETFGEQGFLTAKAAAELGLQTGTPITYRAGDQPNNAFSLNVLHPGEIAATAGTSGVIYGITDRNQADFKSRVNTFVHVNDSETTRRNGVLLCINGTGILNSWLRRMTGGLDYDAMNAAAAKVAPNAEGVIFLPFGNGAERVLENRQLGAQLLGVQFNRHGMGHLFRAAQEGIVFSLNYGFEIMKTLGVQANTIRAGHANLFLSPIFREAFANTTGATIELYNTDGATGAARGAGIGVGFYKNFQEAFTGLQRLKTIEPTVPLQKVYQEGYHNWSLALNNALNYEHFKMQTLENQYFAF
jgi:xylulokinase